MSYAHPVTSLSNLPLYGIFFFFFKSSPKKPHFWGIIGVLLGSEGVFLVPKPPPTSKLGGSVALQRKFYIGVT